MVSQPAIKKISVGKFPSFKLSSCAFPRDGMIDRTDKFRCKHGWEMLIFRMRWCIWVWYFVSDICIPTNTKHTPAHPDSAQPVGIPEYEAKYLFRCHKCTEKEMYSAEKVYIFWITEWRFVCQNFHLMCQLCKETLIMFFKETDCM